jgi:hypothetical protein
MYPNKNGKIKVKKKKRKKFLDLMIAAHPCKNTQNH